MTTAGGTRNVGTWRFSGPTGVICAELTGRLDPTATCYSFHEDAGRFAVKLVSGPPLCLPGNIEFK